MRMALVVIFLRRWNRSTLQLVDGKQQRQNIVTCSLKRKLNKAQHPIQEQDSLWSFPDFSQTQRTFISDLFQCARVRRNVEEHFDKTNRLEFLTKKTSDTKLSSLFNFLPNALTCLTCDNPEKYNRQLHHWLITRSTPSSGKTVEASRRVGPGHWFSLHSCNCRIPIMWRAKQQMRETPKVNQLSREEILDSTLRFSCGHFWQDK